MGAQPDDSRFMAAAIRLSRHHTGRTSTNPSVGCVIVKDGVIVSSAVTALGGRPHAETQALDLAGEAARGATVYVTLEPCSHWGRTPPCADALVASGVARVVIALTDPDPRVSGRGIAIMRAAGITVECGLLAAEARRSLQAYLMRHLNGRPHVTLKLALSADGMIGRRQAGQVAITGPVSRAQVHVLRAEMDAILVGIGTALADDPELNVRLPGLEDRSPVRIVLDRYLRLPITSKLVQSARKVPVIIAALPVPNGTVDSEHAVRRRHLAEAGIEILEAADLPSLLSALAQRGLSSLLVEGGASVARSFLAAELVDRILLYQATAAIGEDGIESPVTDADIPPQFTHVRSTRFGDDRCCDYERTFECSPVL